MVRCSNKGKYITSIVICHEFEQPECSLAKLDDSLMGDPPDDPNNVGNLDEPPDGAMDISEDQPGRNDPAAGGQLLS